jgi:hypothetical protein
VKRSQRSQQTALAGGGILIGNTYSFLTAGHKADTAQRLSFFERPSSLTDLPQQSAG